MNKKTTQKMGYWGLFGLLFLSIFAFTLEQHKATPTNILNAEVSFGRGPNCTSRGICSLDDPGATGGTSNSLLQNNAQIHLNTKGNPVLTIFKNSISVATKEAQFINGYFEQSEDIDIPGYFSSQYSSFSNKKLKAGTYPVIELEDRYSISFE